MVHVAVNFIEVNAELKVLKINLHQIKKLLIHNERREKIH